MLVDAATGARQIVEITSVEKSNWTRFGCEISQFNSGDGCNCGCGVYDPDCGAPSMQKETAMLLEYYPTWDQNQNVATPSAFVKGCDDISASADGYRFCNLDGTCVQDNDDPPTESTFSFEDSVAKFVETVRFQAAELKTGAFVGSNTLVHNFAVGSKFETALSVIDNILYRSMSVEAVIPVAMQRGEAAYKPSDRAASTAYEKTVAPQTLNAEVALITVPDRQSFGELDLCPTRTMRYEPKLFRSSQGWQHWRVRNSSELEVKNCLMEKVSRSETDRCLWLEKGNLSLRMTHPDQYRAVCAREVFCASVVFVLDFSRLSCLCRFHLSCSLHLRCRPRTAYRTRCTCP